MFSSVRLAVRIGLDLPVFQHAPPFLGLLAIMNSAVHTQAVHLEFVSRGVARLNILDRPVSILTKTIFILQALEFLVNFSGANKCLIFHCFAAHNI